MPTLRIWRNSSAPSITYILLAIFLAIVVLAGGASRADVFGQVVVRMAAYILLIVAIVFGEDLQLRKAWAVAMLLAAFVALPLLQLVPVPPDLWRYMPTSSVLSEASATSGHPTDWYPWSIAPGATINALWSLIVPTTTFFFLLGLAPRDWALLPGFLIGLIVASMLVGLLQVSGASFDNPLINDLAGQVAGTFANRNHFAVFLALGCLAAPVWAFLDGREAGWRAPVALGLIALFMLTILASGSRAGTLIGGVAIILGPMIVWQNLRRTLRRYPRWVSFALIGGAVAFVVLVILISVAVGRAVSVDRVFGVDQGQDMRARGLPAVLAMILEHFPFGSGLGSFDATFRMVEPFSILKATYFNHAHNDLLEIVNDAGVFGLLLLFAGLAWFVMGSYRAWRAGGGTRYAIPKLGSAMLLLMILASAFDYPGRTPLMMAMAVIAAVWLRQCPAVPSGSALRTRG